MTDLVSNSDKIDQLSDQWATRRPEELKPAEFIALTAEIYGRVDEKVVSSKNVDASVTIPDSTVTTLPVNKILGRRLRRYPKESESITINSEDDPASEYRSPLIWRKAMFENKA